MEPCTCFNCGHRGREQLGPHEYLHFCNLHQPHFLNIRQCNRHEMGKPMEDEDRWPSREKSGAVSSEPQPVYFTGAKNNRVQHDFMVRPVGDLVEVNGSQFTADDAEAVALAILEITRKREVGLCLS